MFAVVCPDMQMFLEAVLFTLAEEKGDRLSFFFSFVMPRLRPTRLRPSQIL